MTSFILFCWATCGCYTDKSIVECERAKRIERREQAHKDDADFNRELEKIVHDSVMEASGCMQVGKDDWFCL